MPRQQDQEERAEWQPPSAPSMSVPLTDLGDGRWGPKRRSPSPPPRPASPDKAPKKAVAVVTVVPMPRVVHVLPYGILVDEGGSAQGYVRAYSKKEKKFDLYTPGLYSSTIRPEVKLEGAPDPGPNGALGKEVWELTHEEAKQLAANSAKLRDFWGMGKEFFGLKIDPSLMPVNKRDSLIEFGGRHCKYDLGPAPKHMAEETSRVMDYFLNVYLDLSTKAEAGPEVFSALPKTPDPNLVGTLFVTEKHLIEALTLDDGLPELPDVTRLDALEAYSEDFAACEEMLMHVMDGLVEYRLTEEEVREVHAIVGILAMAMQRLSTLKGKSGDYRSECDWTCRPDSMRAEHIHFINDAIKGVDVTLAADSPGVSRPLVVDLYHVVPVPPSIFRIYVGFFVSRKAGEDAAAGMTASEQLDNTTKQPKTCAVMGRPAGGRKLGAGPRPGGGGGGGGGGEGEGEGEDEWDWGFDWWVTAGYVAGLWWRDHLRFCRCVHHLRDELKHFVLGDQEADSCTHRSEGSKAGCTAPGPARCGKGPLLGALCRLCGVHAEDMAAHLRRDHNLSQEEMARGAGLAAKGEGGEGGEGGGGSEATCHVCGAAGLENMAAHLREAHVSWVDLAGHPFTSRELQWEVWRTRYLERVRYENVMVFKYMRWVRWLWNDLLGEEVEYLRKVWQMNPQSRKNMECWDFKTKPVRLARFAGVDVKAWTGRIVSLDFGGWGLTKLPDDITPIKYLRELHVSSNLLRALPRSLHKLPFLEAIHAENNKLRHVPPHLHKLAGLKSLSLLRNKIARVPASLGQCPALLFLNLCQNVITSLPPELCELASTLRYFLVLDNQNVLKADLDEEEKLRMDFLVQTYRGGNTVMMRHVPAVLQPAIMESVQFFKSPIFRDGLHKGPWTYRMQFDV